MSGSAILILQGSFGGATRGVVCLVHIGQDENGLALAYDKVLRKGCALAMLKRLDALAANPKFGAEPQINRVLDNESWFKPYRTDALKALGK